MRLKLTLSYKQAIGMPSQSTFKNVHVNLSIPENVYTEKTMFKFDMLNFEGRSTPPVLQLYLYPKTSAVPTDNKITVVVTSQQVNYDGNG